MRYWPLIHAFLKCAKVRHTEGLRFPRQKSLRFLQGISTKMLWRPRAPGAAPDRAEAGAPLSSHGPRIGGHASHHAPPLQARRGTASLRGGRRGMTWRELPRDVERAPRGAGLGASQPGRWPSGPPPTPESAGSPQGPAFPEGGWHSSPHTEGKKNKPLPLHSPDAVPASVLRFSRISEAILEAVSREETPFPNPERGS